MNCVLSYITEMPSHRNAIEAVETERPSTYNVFAYVR